MAELEWASHKGWCCESCLEDKAEGYGDDIEGCCCRAIVPADEHGEPGSEASA